MVSLIVPTVCNLNLTNKIFAHMSYYVNSNDKASTSNGYYSIENINNKR